MILFPQFFFTYPIFSLSNLVDLELFDAGALADLSTHLILNQFLRRLWLGLTTHSDHSSGLECKANMSGKGKFFAFMKQ